MTPRSALTAEQLRDVLNYDPATGIFTWKKMNRRHWLLGTVAGCPHSRGYVKIFVKGHTYFAHRLAWLYVRGEWPPEEVDHINGDRSDNRISNLRLATRSQNRANTFLRTDNTSGIKGVSMHSTSKRWRARVYRNGVETHLGFFNTKEEAAEAYRVAALESFGQFAATRTRP